MIVVTTAPIQDALVEKDGLLGKVWRQWFSATDDSLRGLWGKDTVVNLETTNVTYDSVEGFYKGVGKAVVVSLNFVNIASTSGTIKLPFKVENGFLPVSEKVPLSGNIPNLIGGALVSGDTISIENLTNSQGVIIQGTLILR